MSDPLRDVRKAAEARKRAEAAYQAALQAARDRGVSTTAISRAAGVSRQRVLQRTTRP